MNILIVEDSQVIQKSIEKILQQYGYSSTSASSGEEALQSFETEKPDLILMDVEMPGIDGYETTKQIRDREKELQTKETLDNWVPIIFLSSRMDESSVEKGISVGGDDYLAKPISNGILHAKIIAMNRIKTMQNKIANQAIELKEVNEQIASFNEKLVTSNRLLEELSLKDGLTKIPNRRAFEDELRKNFLLALRNESIITIGMIDIDYFKQYNDHFGHTAGDECLVAVAAALRQTLGRPTDLVARYGGEEFVALMPGTPESGAKIIGELLRKNVEDLKLPQPPKTPSDVVTVSIGIATVQHVKGMKVADLVNRADEALYESKKRGRNCVTINNEPTTDVS